MAPSEPVYRHYNAGSETATSGGLVDAVPGFPERRGFCLSGLHCRTMRTATPNGQHSNRRTRSPRIGEHDSYRGSRPGRLEVSGSPHDSKGQIVSAFADIVVSAFVDFPGQHLLTLSIKDIQKRIFLILSNDESPLPSAHFQNRTAKRLTAAVRNRSTRNPISVSASVGGSGWVSQCFCASPNAAEPFGGPEVP